MYLISKSEVLSWLLVTTLVHAGFGWYTGDVDKAFGAIYFQWVLILAMRWRSTIYLDKNTFLLLLHTAQGRLKAKLTLMAIGCKFLGKE